jgi:hypothetical protein
MSPPGWYPDPGGGPAPYRYWDGAAWTEHTGSDPAAAAPDALSGVRPAQRRGLLAVVAVVLAVLVVVAVGVVRTERSPLTGSPGSVGTPVETCPVDGSAIDGPTDRPPDGRVRGGALSYPELGPPWSSPRTDDRVAYGRDVHQQTIEVERTTSVVWYASVLVAALDTGQGFVAPQHGAQLMARCIIAHFYADTDVRRDDQVNQAWRVGGHDAWRIESRLHFAVPGIEVTSELMIMAVVDVGGGRAALFYASVPDSVPALVPVVRQTMTALRVG